MYIIIYWRGITFRNGRSINVYILHYRRGVFRSDGLETDVSNNNVAHKPVFTQTVL